MSAASLAISRQSARTRQLHKWLLASWKISPQRALNLNKELLVSIVALFFLYSSGFNHCVLYVMFFF
jgi:hypothetical protein